MTLHHTRARSLATPRHRHRQSLRLSLCLPPPPPSPPDTSTHPPCTLSQLPPPTAHRPLRHVHPINLGYLINLCASNNSSCPEPHRRPPDTVTASVSSTHLPFIIIHHQFCGFHPPSFHFGLHPYSFRLGSTHTLPHCSPPDTASATVPE